MIQIFKGCDPNYQQHYTDIKTILKKEYCLDLPEPMDSDIYIYWRNADYFASGGVRLTLDQTNDHSQYILKNIAFHVDFDAYDREFENDEDSEIVEQLGVEFYSAVHTKLYEMVKHQTVQLSSRGNKIKKSDKQLDQKLSQQLDNQSNQESTLDIETQQTQVIAFPTLSSEQLLMQLFHEELEDCIVYGCWSCDEGEVFYEYYHSTILHLSEQDRLNCLEKLAKFQIHFIKEEEE